MLSYRSQTSRFVYPTARKAYRNRNLQTKLTTHLTPSTDLRLTGLYGVAYSAQHYSDSGMTYNLDNNTDAYYYDDRLNGPRESYTGYYGGGRLAGGLGRPTEDLFNEGQNLQNTQYIFQTGARLTHPFSPRMTLDLQYRFQRHTNNAEPIWPAGVYTQRYWIFSLDGALNERGEPRSTGMRSQTAISGGTTGRNT